MYTLLHESDYIENNIIDFYLNNGDVLILNQSIKLYLITVCYSVINIVRLLNIQRSGCW